MKRILAIIILILIVIFGLAILLYQTRKNLLNYNSNSYKENEIPPKELVEPVIEFKSRITKKPYGIFVTPQNSPVPNERFTGYHTGTDIEFEDILPDTPVYAITDGEVLFSGFVRGYGGVLVIRETIQNQELLVLYGHLNPSAIPAKNSLVKKGQQIAILGKNYSSETDGERKHLHLGFIKGGQIDFRGYVQNPSELQKWANPIDFFN